MSSIEAANGPLAPCSAHAIRAIITFGDNVQQAIEQWPSAYGNRQDAKKWAETMVAGTPRSTYDLEVWCVVCSKWEWADRGTCEQCGFTSCEDILDEVDTAAARDGFEDRDRLCATCDEDRREDAKAFDDDPHWRGVPSHGEL